MPKIQPILQVELDPLRPVPEICALIAAVVEYMPGQEQAILVGIKEAIEQRLQKKKGDG